MQVLLLKNVPGLGSAGQIKKVTEGYARNFLLPRKLAVFASDGAVKQSEAIKEAAVRRETKTRGEAEELADILKQISLTFRAKAGEGDRLFGSITAGDISEALAREKRITVDKRKIELPNPIKELGVKQVEIKLHGDVTATVTVVIEKASV
ncbi:MAG: 50S ribosomal protein L9 [Chloroflexi bacterium]|nr:50S ribosomal protein L9 [Chloroflexota bacterium]MBI3741107.1 50S ribosomal protein L9 [Chloroflexota bacterium]